MTFAVLTTVAAFSPAAVRTGDDGQDLSSDTARRHPVPCCSSLVESLDIQPAHLSHIPKRDRRGPWRRFQSRFADGLKLVRAGGLLPRARDGAPLAVPDGVDRRGRHDRDHRPGALGAAVLPFHALHRGRCHLGVGDDAAGDAGRCHRGSGGEASRRARRGSASGCSRRPGATTSCTCWRRSATSRWRGGGPDGPPVGSSSSSSNVGEVAIELLPTEQRIYGLFAGGGEILRQAFSCCPSVAGVDEGQTSTTTTPPASATTGRGSTAACAPCARATCSSSGSSTASAATCPICRLAKVGLRVLAGQGAQIDTTTAAGCLVFGIFAALVEFER